VNRLSIKLSLAFVLCVVIAIGIVGIFANRAMVNQFSAYLQTDSQTRVVDTATDLADYYNAQRGWAGVDTYLQTLPISVWGDWLLLDDQGQIVSTSAPWIQGIPASDIRYDASAVINVGDRQVGTLYISSIGFSENMGGMMGGRTGRMHARGPGIAPLLGATEQRTVLAFNRSLLWAGVISGLAAIMLAIFFTFSITSPIRRLKHAAHQIASGNLGHQVTVRSRDEIGELADSFNNMADTLSRNEQTRRALMADIAHELHTPLTILQGNLEAMQDGVIEPSTANLASLHEETLHLARLVADLRELSLAESGQLKLNVQETDVTALAEKVVSVMQPMAEEKHISLSLRSEPGIPPAMVDPGRVAQVLRNLLSNALRYTPEEGRVELSISPQSNDKGVSRAIELTVSDTGCGIEPTDLPHVFDRFYRTDRSRSRASGGSGIGLSIVKQLVELHGGTVSVQSEPGAGSTFIAILPLKPPSSH